ncbi:MAG: hypothetical protein A2045_06180 [Rhodocyclales bacterium GWA2_65_20]|nr:MAG: hypothetical protein A2045_06180 [Rhodocyclales bacterium GWA2_65_20]
MPTFEWRNIFSVGHEDIDRQHQQLFAIANELYDAVRERSDVSAESLENALKKLCAYTRQHFEEEERLLQAARYPDFDRHKKSHDLLLGKVEEFEARFRSGEAEIATELLPFLVGEWLSHHIAFEDMQYAPYLNRHLRHERACFRPSGSRSPQRQPD